MKPSVPGKPWHVVHVIGHMRTGGAERQLLNYLLAADRTDFRHSLVCLESPGELAMVANNHGVNVKKMSCRTRTLPLSVRRFAQWLQDGDVAIVHCHMHHAAFWGRLGGIAAGVPVLLTTEHGKELWKGPVRLMIDRILSRWTAVHIAVSEDGMRLRQQREKIRADKLVLIPNGVPIPEEPRSEATRLRIRAELGVPKDAIVLGTVGRVVAAKGYEHLVGALARLIGDFPDLVWLAVGDGDLRPSLAEAVVAAGLQDSVVWVGRRDDVGDLLAAMDLWVMSSVREGLPVALLEAMAAALPIVATRVGGIPDAVRDGREGVLVPPGDPIALAEGIRRMLAGPDRAAALGDAARRRAMADYGINSIARRIEDIYRRELLRAEAGGAS